MTTHVGALKDWDLTERIGGMSFDTTSSNTGRNNGACVLIEQQLKKDLLYFACRHHVLELLFAEAFKTVPPRGVRFLAPGPMHHARWMSKAIYALNVWMFQSQFKLTAREEKGLQQIAVFVSRLYAKAWTLALEAAAAPRHDLQLLKDLTTYMDNVNWDVGKAALTKLQGHLWYLSEELVALAVFDPLVTVEEKRQILTSLHTTVGDESPAKRPKLPSQAVSGLQLQDMASTNTRWFFQKLRLEDGFLDADPATWLEREDFRTAAAFVQGIAVINDHAERGVALIQEYN
ncbi:hypothetical protein AAFF_G00382200 [Aldrovandia affinis]|uniref:Uncharacterized protein n=1 Tax=Aldrovandia affinis TaxID=143900 RepID=A0AAD7T8M9_9TELE|nr:hypothetical protein AAFF_G00382200 [Aldrovandia affinis]